MSMIGDYYAIPFPTTMTYAHVLGTEIAVGDIVQAPLGGWRTVATTALIRGRAHLTFTDGTEYTVRYGWDMIVGTPV